MTKMNFENYHFFQRESKNTPKRKLAICELQKNISKFKNINQFYYSSKQTTWMDLIRVTAR